MAGERSELYKELYNAVFMAPSSSAVGGVRERIGLLSSAFPSWVADFKSERDLLNNSCEVFASYLTKPIGYDGKPLLRDPENGTFLLSYSGERITLEEYMHKIVAERALSVWWCREKMNLKGNEKSDWEVALGSVAASFLSN